MGTYPGWPGQLVEMYSYTVAGAVTKKRLRLRLRPGIYYTVDKDVTYTYGTDGRLATVLYPWASIPFAYSYDLMGRPVGMTGPGAMGNQIDHVKDVGYNAAGQVTAMKYLQYEIEAFDSNGDRYGVPVHFQETKT